MRVLITAGPTREWMDPVRFLSNPSSGAMVLAIASALQKKSASITVVLGPTHLSPPSKIRVVRVETAKQMFSVVKSLLHRSDVFIASAAVGDWRFARTSETKLKKENSSSMTVRLEKNPDILAWVGEGKKKRTSPLCVVGFALETERLKTNAEKKLKRKNLDLIIANGPASFSDDKIHARWIEKNKAIQDLGNLNKKVLAAKLAAWLDKKWMTLNR